MDLSRVNKIAKCETYLPTKKMDTLKPFKTYKNTDLKELETVYGTKVVPTVRNSYMIFSPPRTALNYFSDLIKMMEVAYTLLPSSNHESSEIIDKWVRISSDNITTLNRHLQSSGLSVGEKQRIQSIIAAPATLHEKFINHSIVGGSLQSTEQFIRWKDLENVFRNRIRTSVVMNMQHLNSRDFLSVAEKLITEKLTDIVTSEGNLKVNFVLACKFSNQTNDGTVVEIKYFNVQNEAILPSTDIKKHFLKNVVDKLLTKVEDFQERDSEPVPFAIYADLKSILEPDNEGNLPLKRHPQEAHVGPH
ncbi:uncharacterized protein [Chelonus insularis]|uniref:uncharacterized protein n=1 Tax=Chelonus insularis TaxID=460826 RepID=UPI00158E87C2|nr:uncharacterized protein LOC118066655 [Chelonus insularis]